MGNSLSAGQLMVSLVGILGVFIVLIILCRIIPLIAPVSQQSKQVPAAAKPSAPVAHPASAPGAVVLSNVDEITAACIMAIVSDETGIALSELIFKTIKAV